MSKRLSTKFLIAVLKNHLWWLDVFYPILLGLGLFAALSYVVYSGPRQSRLSLRLEKRLLEFSLREGSGRAPAKPDMVRIITPLWRESDDVSVDAGKVIEFYAESIEHLSAAKIPFVLVHWQAEVRGSYDKVFDRLQRVVSAVSPATKLYFVASPQQIEQIPLAFRQTSNWLNDSLCDEIRETQLDCSYVPEYQGWVIQQIFQNANPNLAASAVGSSWLSDQLANGFSGYVLNISSPNSVSRQRMSKLGSINALPNKLQVAIISAELERDSQNLKEMSESVFNARQNRVRTVYDGRSFDDKKTVSGTPFHVFWALIAQMLVDEHTINIPSSIINLVWTIIFCLFLVTVMFRGHVLTTIVVFCLFAILAPLVNSIGVKYLSFYWPLFDSLYFGLFVLLSSGLVRLSWVTVQRWRLEAQMRLHSHVTDLKSNFVSLLSHNLNTPVAKMQGMLDVLRKTSQQLPEDETLISAEALVAKLEISIRSVLIAAALEEGIRNESSRRPDHILADFIGSAAGTLRRLGINLCMKPIAAGDEALIVLPVSFDLRALNGALLSLAALFHRANKVGEILVALNLSQDAAGTVFSWEFRSADLFPDKSVLDNLGSDGAKQIRRIAGGEFFSEVMAVFVNLLVDAYAGEIEVIPVGEGGEIKLKLRPN